MKAKTMDDCFILFRDLYDVRESCEQNLKKIVLLFIEKKPSLEEILIFSKLRREYECDKNIYTYISAYIWLGLLNAQRVYNKHHNIYGVEYLNVVRSHCSELLAPTFEYPRDSFLNKENLNVSNSMLLFPRQVFKNFLFYYENLQNRFS